MYKIIYVDNKETNYEVNEEGIIRNKQTLKILQGNQKKSGYIEYCLYIDTKPVYLLGHRIVAKAFIPNPNNLMQVNHINGIKTDNHVENLEWVSSSDNNLHAWRKNLNKPHITRAVNQYDLKGNFIQSFNSLTEAVKATGATKIRETCNGVRKSSGGYTWQWVEDFIPEDRGKKKKVAQLDNNDNVIAIFESVSEAARQTGANRKGISAVCLGKQKTCFNYKWKFLFDDIVQ